MSRTFLKVVFMIGGFTQQRTDGSHQINPWILSDESAATVCKTDACYPLKETEILLTGLEKKKHFA
jgi:hypothetical protein